MSLKLKDKYVGRVSQDAAGETLGVKASLLRYAAWEQTFTTTAGPFKRAGGRAMSVWLIEAWYWHNQAFIFCEGQFLEVTSEFSTLYCFDVWGRQEA